MENKEKTGDKLEDQLLKDASALLMFANVAAKQHQEKQTSPPVADSNLVHASATHSRAHSLTQSPSERAKTEPEPSEIAQPAPGPVTTSPAPPLAQKPESQPETEPKVPSAAPSAAHSAKSSISEPQPEQVSPKSPKSPKKSPSVLHPNLNLERGINIKTGERNTNNAVIAAAALAAAADIPLPLLKKNEPAVKEESTQEIKPSEPSEPLQQQTEVKQPFRPPPLASYQVDPDSGLIGCICGIEDDDGFTIQCDVCFRWQHCLCMDFKTNEEVPEDEYKCYNCDEAKWGKFNPEACKQQTLDRLANEKASQGAPVPGGNEAIPVVPAQQNPKLKRKHLTTGNEENKRKKQDKSKNASANDKATVSNGNNASHSESQTVSAKKGPEDSKPSHPEEPASASKSEQAVTNPESKPVVDSSEDFLPNKDNELLDDGMTAEFYQSVYYKLRQNDYKNSSVKEQFDTLGYQFFHDITSQAIKESLVEVMPLTQFQTLKLSKVILPNHQKYLQDRNELRRNKGFNKTSIQIKSYGDNPKQRFNGITRLGLFISERVPSLSEFIISKDTPIIEFMGEVNFFSNYRDNRTNQYSTWGTTKPRVVMSSLKLDNSKDSVDVVLDARFVGNEARFIRKSCPFTSNCYIKPVYVPQTNNFRYLVYTSKDIVLTQNNSEEELRLDWGWDPKHPILKMYNKVNPETNEVTEGLKVDQFADEEKALLISGIDNILHFVECGCTTSSQSQQCAMYKIKKATSYLLRSTRKASGMSNIQLAKAREELTKPKKTREFISWNERLVERDQVIQMKLSISTTNDGNEENEGNQEAVNGNQVSEDNAPVEEKEDDVDSESVSDEVSKSSNRLSYQVPYKNYLISQNRKRIQQLKAEVNNATEVKEESSSFIVPIAPEVVVEIKQDVEKEIKPLKDSVPTLVPSLPKSHLSHTNITQLNETKEQNTPSLSQDNSSVIPEKQEVESNNPPPNPETSAIPKHPVVVKKLSFADYKKKMK